MRRAAIVVVLALACGVKGPPLPPLREAPAATPAPAGTPAPAPTPPANPTPDAGTP